MNSWQVSWRILMRKKWRSFLTVIAIAVGVGATTAVLSTVQTTERTLEEIADRADGNADFYISSSEGRLTRDWVERAAAIKGVAATVGRLDVPFSLDRLPRTSTEARTSTEVRTSTEANASQNQQDEPHKVNVIGVDDMTSDILQLEVLAGDLTADGLVVDEKTAAVWDVQVGDRVTLGQRGNRPELGRDGTDEHSSFGGTDERANRSDQRSSDNDARRRTSDSPSAPYGGTSKRNVTDHSETHEVTVTAVVRNPLFFFNPDSWAAASGRAWHVLLPLETLQEWLGQDAGLEQGAAGLEQDTRRIDKVYVRAQDDLAPRFVREQLDESLASAPEEGLRTRAVVADRHRVGVGFAELYSMLYVIGGISLILSAFIMYNTSSMSVAERRDEFAIMKTYGYTPRQITGHLFRELFLLAFTGALLGLGLGFLLSLGLTDILFQSFQDKIQFRIEWLTPMIAAFSAGIVIPLAAAIVPLVNASRISAVDVFKGVATPLEPALESARVILGLAMLLPSLFVNHMVAFVPFFLGIALLLPYAFAVVQRIPAPLNRLLFGRESRFTVQNIARHKSRTAWTAASLSFGITLVVFLGSLVLSFEQGAIDLTRQTSGGDVRVNYDRPRSAEQIGQLQQIDGVQSTTAVQRNDVNWQAGDQLGTFDVYGVNEEQMARSPIFSSGETAANDQHTHGELLEKLKNPRTVVLGVTAYERWDGKVGEQIALDTATGIKPFTVVGVVKTMTRGGYVGFVHEDAFARDFHIGAQQEVLLNVADGREQTVKKLIWQSDATHIAHIATLPDILQVRVAQTEKMTTLLRTVAIFSIIVAGIGMANAWLMQVMARRGEVGTMRALGFTRWQVMKVILSEAFISGTVAALVGGAMGVLMMYLTAVQNGDLWMPLPFAISWKSVWAGFALALVTSGLASLLPGWKAANVSLNETLKNE
ncbi:FtsX-like permease family protein [Numidum massiliense]|uniref:FtsX-like permease family protein n=1 Tax=Numidum massiliense TaxID=1522315 RepID=UPI0006D5B2F9|nr:FtsX-like permease family protein [Numidum massiliense]